MDYEVTTDGWLDGSYRRKGEVIKLSPEEAKYLLRAGTIIVHAPTSAKADKPTRNVKQRAGED